MADDPDSIPEREMKDFQFRQMKKIRVFESCLDLPKERSSLLTISNKYNLTFAARDRTLKIFWSKDLICAGLQEGNPNDTVECVSAMTADLDVSMHHVSLSCDELTLCVCGLGENANLMLHFYDVRSFFSKQFAPAHPFCSYRPEVSPQSLVQDVKWSPVEASRLALCVSDGSMVVLDVQESVSVVKSLPASAGVTCLCWSPKGKQVAAGKNDATVVQFTPILEAKKVIPCPSFYSQDHPVKVLDVLWLSTYSFAVAYAAADGSLETPPELVMVSLPKKDEKRGEHYLNFNDLVYGTCTERQHHYYLNHIEDWDLVLAASAAATEVSIIAKQEDKMNWEQWLLEDASRAELPVTESSDDTLPVGMAIDYTSKEEIRLSDEKKLPPVPTLLLLSTDGVLCPFSLLNLNPGVKQLNVASVPLPQGGERVSKDCKSSFTAATSISTSSSTFPSFPASSGSAKPSTTSSFPALSMSLQTSAFTAPPPSSISFSAPPTSPGSISAAPQSTTSLSAPPTSLLGLGLAATAPPSSSPSFSAQPPAYSAAPTTSSGFSFSLAPTGSSGGPFGSTSAGFSFSAAKPPLSSSAAGFSFASSVAPPSQSPLTVSPVISSSKVAEEPVTPAVKINLTDRFSAVETTAPSLSLTSTPKLSMDTSKAVLSRVGVPPVKPAAAAPQASSTSSAQVSAKAQQQKKDSDPVMTGILEEMGLFKKELEDLKSRCRVIDFTVGSSDEMKELRNESEKLQSFTLEIKDTTESLHGDVSLLKTSLLEGFAGAEDAQAQSELNQDRNYLQLLYKKPLDPRRDQQIKEIRRLYQYVKFAMEDVNGVLDLEWEMHLERKKKQRHLLAPERESLFTSLKNHLEIIVQQKQRLERLSRDLHTLRLYRGEREPASSWSHSKAPSLNSLDGELENLKEALLKASLETTPKSSAKSPSKMTPAKQSQLRNFLSKRQTPPVRSTAPANLSRSAFLSPQLFEDLDALSSTSSLSQPLEPEDSLAVAEVQEEEEEEEEEQDNEVSMPMQMPSLIAPRHPAVVRMPSIQPGFGVGSSPFSRVQSGIVPLISTSPKIDMDSADSTALATKTVKHGAPPTEKTTPTTLPASQAAGRAALNRHMSSQKPVALSESTHNTVPQVVNVQELQDRTSAGPLSTILSPSVPAPAAQVVQQVLATVEANKSSFQAAQTPSGNFMFGSAVQTDSAGASSVAEKNTKSFSFTPASSGFSFTSPQDANGAQAKSSSQPGKFSFASSTAPKVAFEEPFSFKPKPTSASQALSSSTTEPAKIQIPQPARVGGVPTGETLGSFSGLRVGPTEDAPKISSGFGFGSPANGSKGFSFTPAESTGSSDSAGATVAEAPDVAPSQGFNASTFAFKPQEGGGLLKPAFAVPSTASISATATSFGSLLRAPLPETLAPEASTFSSPVPSTDAEAEPSPKLSAEHSVDFPSLSASDRPVPPSSKPPTPPNQEVETIPSETSPCESVPVISEAPVKEPSVEGTTISTATTPQESLTAILNSAPVSDKPGSIFTQASESATSSTTVVTSTPSSISSASTAPTPVFGQTPASTAQTSFGSASFGATSGFGKPSFGQSAAFGQAASSSGSAGGFGFGKPVFSVNSGFGQISTTTTPSSSGTGLFGSGGATSSASSFSFAAGSTSSAPSTGTGLFGQGNSSGFGQPSTGFGQGAVFGSATTTASSSGFGFGQTSAFGSCSTSSSSVFGQQAGGTSVFGQAQSSAGLFGSSSGNSGSGAGFFSGLGGKPSDDAANKNPFGAPAAGGFGQSINTAPASLFGSSGAKSFSFAGSSFGDQKQAHGLNSGSFSSGAGSVAAQGFGSFNTPSKSGGFGSAPVFGSPPTFGGSPAFGATGGFNSAPSFSSPVTQSTGKVFGEGTSASNVGGFGFSSPQSTPSFGNLVSQNPGAQSFESLANQSTASPSFGSMANQATGFGSQGGGFSAFGSPGGFGGFGSNNQSSSQTFNSWRS